MGYNTDYTLTTDTKLENTKKFSDKFTDITDYYLEELSGKWYDWNEDMIKISKLYPDTLFTLHGDGEESEDIWTHYFKNGKSQNAKAKITIESFDESKLS